LVGGTAHTDGDGKWQSNEAALTLFAHWEADSTPVGPGISDEAKDGDVITIAEQDWGVLREFYGGTYESTIDSPDVDATKKLIIKYGDVYQTSQTSQASDFKTQYFYDSNGTHSSTQYFVSENDTGYDSSFVKKEMDRYYNETIATTDIAPYIMPVNLDLPTFTRFTTEAITLFDPRNVSILTPNPPLTTGLNKDGFTFPSWNWDNVKVTFPGGSEEGWIFYAYLDTRFKTLLTGNEGTDKGKKQAFALSYGDLSSLPLDKSGEYQGKWGKKWTLKNCLAQFYLRTPLGYNSSPFACEQIGSVSGASGTFRDEFRNLQQIDDNGKAAIVPALWISTRPIHNVTLNNGSGATGSTALTVTEGSKFIYGLENTDEMPKKDGSTFAGYFTSAEGGEQVIDDKGKLVTAETAETA
jgi:hypothetical protein